MALRIIFSAICLFAGGCASSVVHIYSLGLESSEAAEIREAIESAGFKARLNSLAPPENLRGPTLIYSPYRKDLADIDRLETLLAEIGYTVLLEQESFGNHFYTRNNIGFFPNPVALEEVEDSNVIQIPGAQMSLVGREFSADCGVENMDGYLLLEEGGRFTLDFLVWDDTKSQPDTETVSGNWELVGQLVQLSSAKEAAPFIIEASLDDNEGGNQERMLAIIELHNVLSSSGVFHSCDFSHVGSITQS